MEIRKINKPYQEAQLLLLDAESFLFESKVGRDNYLPVPVRSCLQDLQTDHYFLFLFDVKSTMDKWRQRLTGQDDPSLPGRTEHLEIGKWGQFSIEKDAPILYYERPSSSRFWTIPANRRIMFSTDPKIARILIGKFNRIHTKDLDKDDMAKKRAQVLRRRINDKFSKKFY